MAIRFKNKKMQRYYDLGLTVTYPIPIDFNKGKLGGSARIAWENGYLGIKVTRYDKKSTAYACWCAGKEVKRREELERSGITKTIKFRRGKKFQNAYYDIGNTNQMIGNLKIEADTFKKYRKYKEAKWRLDQIAKLKADLRKKYDPETFDLDYYLGQISGLYVRRNRRCVL